MEMILKRLAKFASVLAVTLTLSLSHSPVRAETDGPDLFGGGQQADGESGEPHQRDGDQERALAAGAVADLAEYQRAERARDEAKREGEQRENKRLRIRQAGDEQRRYDGRDRAVNEEIVPLENGAG